MIRSTDRLTGIRIAGFKSAMAPVQVNFKDITILAGANSAGKSTIMQPLLMLKQTIEKPFDPGALAIDGPLVRFTSTDQFLSSRDEPDRFEATYYYGAEFASFRYRRLTPGGVDLDAMTFSDGGKDYVWQAGDTFQNATRLPKIGLPVIDDAIDTLKGALTGAVFQVRRDRASLVVGLVGAHANNERFLAFLFPGHTVLEHAADLIHLPGLRGNPERSYAISATGRRYPGRFNDYVASIIHAWNVAKDDRVAKLETSLKRLGLTWRVTTRMADDTKVEVMVGRLPSAVRGGARDTVNIADVGFGVSQTLPVLVAFLAAEPDQIVFVEQPEIHLHPKAQVVMADLLVDAANRGVRLVIETHSSLLILALQAAIAEQRIDPGRISMNWFTRDGEGQTVVTEAELGADGSYGEWPVDFDDVELTLQDRFMTGADRRHAVR